MSPRYTIIWRLPFQAYIEAFQIVEVDLGIGVDDVKLVLYFRYIIFSTCLKLSAGFSVSCPCPKFQTDIASEHAEWYIQTGSRVW